MQDESFWQRLDFKKERIDLIQINLGNKCNLQCSHCHVDASPSGDKNMDEATAVKIIAALKESDVRNIEFTGGAPELNPNLKMFIENLSGQHKNMAVRTNLTILNLPAYSFYCDLFAKYKVKVIASLPDIFPDTTDKQRGEGVFKKSIKVLNKLNNLGYGTNGLSLDLVHNPAGDYLPPEQNQLEKIYKKFLMEKYNISFNRLISMVNSPIKRFGDSLKQECKLEDYMNLLKRNYNPDTLNKIMCKSLITIDHDGYIYDCDFNLALNIKTKGCEDKKFWEIDLSDFSKEISFAGHCYACTVNQGSSCHGTLLNEDINMKKNVQRYYGEELQGTSDLKTGACCATDSLPEYIKNVLALINHEITARYYGCGSPIPFCVEGLRALDMGCGTGRDSYVMSKLVGENGFVYGIDMTENQIAVAKRHINEQMIRFGFGSPNVEFIHDNMENITRHIQEESIDLVISNCVINLAEDKEAVLKEIYKILKWGGEFYFSDVYADRRSPDEVRRHPLLFAECLGGALYHKDFIRIARGAGFPDPRIVSQREIDITNPEIRDLTGNIRFYSITYRLWKLRGLEDACEDYGHIVIYRGGIPVSPFSFELDASHIFYKNKPERVCGNTVLMLSKTRFSRYFEIIGDFKEHFGEFKECGNEDKTAESKKTMPGGCC
jgi:radical SAM/Cys-rich protein